MTGRLQHDVAVARGSGRAPEAGMTKTAPRFTRSERVSETVDLGA